VTVELYDPSPSPSGSRRRAGNGRAIENDLDGAGLGRRGEDVIRLLGLLQREAVSGEGPWREPPPLDDPESVGVVSVSTSPVVMVTSLIQSCSRWSVADFPCTPTSQRAHRDG
jgi:hypothetical protein